MPDDPRPRALPHGGSLTIHPRILASIAEIDEFKGAWRALGRLEPERLRGLRRVATIASIGSSTRIEGARLTDREVERLLAGLDPGSFASRDPRSFARRDEGEVAGYAAVLEALYASFESMPVTENLLPQLHRDLLRYSSKDERHRGEYKKLPNHVEAFGPDGASLGIVFVTATPFETPLRMRELVSWLHERERHGDLHPLLVIALFVVVLLEIHPFQDGNGRLSRIVTTLMLLRAGYSYVPYSSLESVVEQRKEDYYRSLRATQASLLTMEPRWEPWLEFFLGALVAQKQHLERLVERESSLATELPELSVVILELARARGRVTVAEATRASGASRNTVKDNLQALVRRGLLARRGAGRGTWYGPI